MAYSRAAGSASYRTFSVQAESKSVVVPDVVKFTFSVITEGKNLESLQEENTTKSNAVIEFLKSSGIEKKDIKTISYSVSPQYQYSPCIGVSICPPPSIGGYSIQQTVEVTVRDFEKASDALAGVVSRGANSVSGLSFTVDDPAKVESMARREAVEKAREKAKELAKAGGFRVGKLVSISDLSVSPPIYPYALDKVEGRGGGGPVIEPGTQDVTASVELTYEIR